MLQKTTYPAPYDGVITNLPVREGETVVIGIQNAQGSTLMTIADMSVITAEVKVDETDIVNVQLGQPADVTIDAIPKKIFHGTVIEIGDNAIVRSSGVSTSQQTTASEEAKDFKVVVTLTDAPPDLRPGLSTTAKITTATRGNALSIPIQALTLAQQGSDRRSKIIRRDRYMQRHPLRRKLHPRQRKTMRYKAYSSSGTRRPCSSQSTRELQGRRTSKCSMG